MNNSNIMVGRRCCFRPIIALCVAASLATYAPPSVVGAQHLSADDAPPRRLEIHGVGNSDEYAQTVLTAEVPHPGTFGIGMTTHDHERISRTLITMKSMMETSRILVQNQNTFAEGRDMLKRANDMFREVKNHIIRFREVAIKETGTEDTRDLMRRRYSDHDVKTAEENEEMAQDTARRIYETVVKFPECVEKLFDDCLAIINADLGSLGLSTIEVVVHEKRNANQDGYNKVVIITNELADKVVGKAGDGIVTYPFMWNDPLMGQRSLGVDGKFNCHNMAPEDCCNVIKQSNLGVDTRGKSIECHIFVPFGGVGNPRRNDRVFIQLSPDGRVHEPPIIQ